MQTKQQKAKRLPQDKKRWTILSILVMSPFMATLDSSIVNVALPVMAQELGVSASAISWVVSAYLIVVSAIILFFGRLGDIIGNIKVLQFGVLVFTIGSALCGLAQSFPMLIVCRILQAVGAAGMMATNHGIITRLFPEKERGRALGINAAFVALGTLSGPALGGLILSGASWELLFWVKVPVGIIVWLVGQKLFPKAEQKQGGRMDYTGAVLFALAVAPLFFAFGQVQQRGLGDTLVLSCFAVAIAAFVLFLFVQHKSAVPLLPLAIFRNKWFSVSIFCAFTSYVTISASNIVLPFYLQDHLQFSPALAGMLMTVYPFVVVMTAPVSGYLSDRIGAQGLTLLGLMLTAAGLLLMSTLGNETTSARIITYVAVMALGNGLFQSPNNVLVMSSVEKDKLGIGGSVNALVRNLGYTAGVAMATTVLYGAMSARLGRQVSGYVQGQGDAFLFGMRMAYIAAALVCLLGAAMTLARLIGRKKAQSLR